MQRIKVTSDNQRRLNRAKKLVELALAEHKLIRVLRPCEDVSHFGYNNGLDEFVQLQLPPNVSDDATMASMNYCK